MLYYVYIYIYMCEVYIMIVYRCEAGTRSPILALLAETVMGLPVLPNPTPRARKAKVFRRGKWTLRPCSISEIRAVKPPAPATSRRRAASVERSASFPTSSS